MKSIKKKKIATKKKPSRKLPAKKTAAAQTDTFGVELLNTLDGMLSLLQRYHQTVTVLQTRVEALEARNKYNQPQPSDSWRMVPPPYAPYEYGTAHTGPQYVDYATAIYGRVENRDGAKKNGA